MRGQALLKHLLPSLLFGSKVIARRNRYGLRFFSRPVESLKRFIECFLELREYVIFLLRVNYHPVLEWGLLKHFQWLLGEDLFFKLIIIY